MTLLVGDGDDCRNHGFCEMLMDNIKIETLKNKPDMGHISDRKREKLLPTTFMQDPSSRRGMDRVHQGTLRIRYQSGRRRPRLRVRT
jgi:hypothetical protein